MKEFGKRSLIVLTFPLWVVFHLIYLFVFVYILAPIGFVVAPLIYLFTGRERYFDTWIDKFDYSLEKHSAFMTKIESL
jgi:hypothetical protein